MQYDELIMYEFVSKKTYYEVLEHLLLHEFQMPLAYFSTKLVGELYNFNSFYVRLPSLVLMMGSSYFIYKTSRMLLGRSDSLKAIILFLCFHPVFIFSSSFRPYSMLVFFSVSSFYYFRRFLQGSRSREEMIFLLLSLLFLLFSHPSGVGLVFLLLCLGALRGDGQYRIFLKYLASLLFLSMLFFVYYRKTDIYSGEDVFTWRDSHFNYFYNLSFLTSGALFTSFSVLISCCSLFVFIKKKKFVDEFNFILIVLPIAIGALCLLVIDKYIQPRHFMFCLPLIAITIIELLNGLTKSMTLKNVCFLIMLLMLMHKSFYKEKIQLNPYEIDTEKISHKLQQISSQENGLPIIMCGNCLSYYIKSPLLECYIGDLKDNHVEKGRTQFLYLEFDFVKKICGIENIDRKYTTKEKHSFVGGTIYWMTKL